MPKKLETKRRRLSSGRKQDIYKLDAVASRKVVMKKMSEGNWKNQFRGSLMKIVRFFQGWKLRDDHIRCLKSTPFYYFIMPFIKGKYTTSNAWCMQAGAVQLFMTYNQGTDSFHIAGKELKIDPEEFDIIFGIKSGSLHVDTSRANFRESSLAKRKFQEYAKVRPGHLKTVLLEYLESTKDEDVADTVRIIVIHLLTSIFFVAVAEQVNWWMFRLVDDLENLREYNWGQAVVSYLMKSVKSKKPEKVRGCTILFMYWICERVSIINPACDKVFPRFRKWRLRDMHDVLTEKALKDILPSQVRAKPIRATDLERLVMSWNEPDEYVTDSDVSKEDETNLVDEATSDGDDEEEEPNGADNGIKLDQTPVVPIGGIDPSSSRGRVLFTELPDTDMDDVPLSAWMAKHPKLMAKLSDQESRIYDLEKQLESGRAEIQLWQTKAMNYQSQNDSLENQLNRLANIPTTSQIECSEETKLRRELETINEELKAEMKINTDLREVVMRLEAENTTLRVAKEILTADSEHIDAPNNAQEVLNDATRDIDMKQPPVGFIRGQDAMITGEMPSFKLLSQSLSTTPSKSTGTVRSWGNTQFTDSACKLIEFSEKQVFWENKEKEYLQKLEEKDTKIKNLSEALDALEGLKFPYPSDDDLDDDSDEGRSTLKRIARRDPNSIVAKRTRAKKIDVSPATINKMNLVGKGYKRLNNYKYLSKETKQVVDDIATAADKDGLYLWKKNDNGFLILVPDIFACIEKKCLSINVIDSYATILKLEQDNGKFDTSGDPSLKGKTFVFDSLLLNKIRSNRKGMFDPPPAMKDTEYRFFAFPILNKNSDTKRGVNHWTLLVMDKLCSDFQFYNSLLPRNNNISDPYIADAIELKKAIVKTCKRHKIDLPYDQTVNTFLDSPQQDPESVDCGVVVLYIIRQFFMHNLLLKRTAEKEVCDMRIEILEALIQWGMQC